MQKRLLRHSYEEIISMENLLEAWCEFAKGKRGKQDVQAFECRLMEHLFELHRSLCTMTYRHATYTAFIIRDPKTRKIHKASVADRVLHRALYRVLYPYFDLGFIHDSYSCRTQKGTHRAIERFSGLARRVTKNYRKTGWVLKCDIRAFFASVDQERLLRMLDLAIEDKRIAWLLGEVLSSFSVEGTRKRGLPLGNLTSQVFSNVYMDVFDRFVKNDLRIKHYVRYADDFVFLSPDKRSLEELLPKVERFLRSELGLEIHPNKIELRSLYSGVDFLGLVHFPHHRVLRTVTKRKMIRKLKEDSSESRCASYRGLLGHGNTKKLTDRLTVQGLL